MHREFIGSAGITALASRLSGAKDAPTRAAKVVKLFKSPEGHPHGLETVKEGFWIGEQISDRGRLVSFEGQLLRSVDTESSNTGETKLSPMDTKTFEVVRQIPVHLGRAPAGIDNGSLQASYVCRIDLV